MPPENNAQSSGQWQWRALVDLLPYLWPRGEAGLRARVVIAMLFLLGAIATAAVVPFLMKAAVDALEGPVQMAAVPVGLILAYGLARVLQRGLGEVRDAVFSHVTQHAMRRVGLETFRHLHRLSLRFHLDRRTGGLNRLIDRGIKAIDFLLRFSLFNVLPTLLQLIVFCTILLVRYDAALASITFMTVVLYILFTIAVTNWRLKFRKAMNESDTAASSRAVDSLLNYETVKYFTNEEHEARRFDSLLARYQKMAIRSNLSLAALNLGQAAIISAGLVAVMLLAAFGIAEGRMSVGDFVLVNAFLIQLYTPLNFLGFVYREIRQSLIDMEAMFRMLDEPAEVSDCPDARPLRIGIGEIRFEDVHFAYEPEREILKGVSFTVPAGQRIAVVGASGAGKSTLSRLLYRFYDVTGGAILIDGQDIRTVTQESLRRSIGIVPQDTVLFNDTLRYNILYGRPDASEEEMRRAARLAAIDAFIEGLPEGYDTMVGERGLKLSGGEKQRVAIARTILKDPRILIFDEATSALDIHTEQEIQASLKAISSNRTTLVIAHRLATVVDADEILVMEAGRIVERGTHAALLAHNGIYAALWRAQAEERGKEEHAASSDIEGDLRPEPLL